MANILIGADPELFVFDKTTDQLVSGCDLIPGTKAVPHRVEGGAVQVDGMALEFNIDPCKTSKEFSAKVGQVVSQMQSMLPENYGLLALPTAHFGKEMIDAQPEHAKELGCEPDFNAYTGGAANPRPNAEKPFRTGAGHIHIGWGEGIDITDPQHIQVCCVLSKQLDYWLGVAAMTWDTDSERRTLYGDKGSFRPKSYGMEYRPLSNAWVADPKLREIVFDLVHLAWMKLEQSYPSVTRPEYVNALFDSGNSHTKRDKVSLLNDSILADIQRNLEGSKFKYLKDLMNKNYVTRSKVTKAKTDNKLAGFIAELADGKDNSACRSSYPFSLYLPTIKEKATLDYLIQKDFRLVNGDRVTAEWVNGMYNAGRSVYISKNGKVFACTSSTVDYVAADLEQLKEALDPKSDVATSQFANYIVEV